MAVQVEQKRLAAPTSTGTQDFTVSGFGTPQCAIFMMCSGQTDSTYEGSIRWSVGAWARYDGTDRQFVTHCSQEDDGESTVHNSTSGADNDAVVKCYDPNTNDGTVEFEAAFSALITDGIRINWTAVEGTIQPYVVCAMFNGLQWAYVDSKRELDLSTPYYDDMVFTGWPGEADWVMGLTPRSDDDDVATGDTLRCSIGFAVNDGSETQASTAWWGYRGNAMEYYEAQAAFGLSTDTFLVHTKGKATDWSWARQLESFDANGITLIQTADPLEGRNSIVGVLAMKFPEGFDFSLDILDTPTSTGTWDITAPGFQPQFAMALWGSTAVVDEIVDDYEASAFAVSTISPAEQYCMAAWYEVGTYPRNSESQVSAAAVDSKMLKAAGSQSPLVGSFTSFDAAGMNLSLSSVPDTSKKCILVTFGEPAAPIEIELAAGTASVAGGVVGTVDMAYSPTAGSATAAGTAVAGDLAVTVTPGDATVAGGVTAPLLVFAPTPGAATAAGTELSAIDMAAVLVSGSALLAGVSSAVALEVAVAAGDGTLAGGALGVPVMAAGLAAGSADWDGSPMSSRLALALESGEWDWDADEIISALVLAVALEAGGLALEGVEVTADLATTLTPGGQTWEGGTATADDGTEIELSAGLWTMAGGDLRVDLVANLAAGAALLEGVELQPGVALTLRSGRWGGSRRLVIVS